MSVLRDGCLRDHAGVRVGGRHMVLLGLQLLGLLDIIIVSVQVAVITRAVSSGAIRSIVFGLMLLDLLSAVAIGAHVAVRSVATRSLVVKLLLLHVAFHCIWPRRVLVSQGFAKRIVEAIVQGWRLTGYGSAR